MSDNVLYLVGDRQITQEHAFSKQCDGGVIVPGLLES